MKYTRLSLTITPSTSDKMYSTEDTSFEFLKEGGGCYNPAVVHARGQKALPTHVAQTQSCPLSSSGAHSPYAVPAASKPKGAKIINNIRPKYRFLTILSTFSPQIVTPNIILFISALYFSP